MIALLFVAAFPCEPSPEVRAKIDALEAFDASLAPRGAHTKNVVTKAEALVAEHPDATTVGELMMFARMYDVRTSPALDPVLTRYAEALLRPKKPREEAMAALAKEQPTFAQAWMGVADASREQARAAFDKARALCPLHPWTVANIGKFAGDRMPALARDARMAVDKLAPPEAARILPALWKVELAVAGVKGIGGARSRIDADLIRLGNAESLAVLSARVTGLELLGQNDTETNDAILRLYPYSEAGNGLIAAMGKSLWAVPKEVRAARANELITKYPKLDDLVPDVFNALVALNQPGTQAVELGKRWAQMGRESRFDNGDTPPQLAVARGYLHMKVGLDLVPALLDEVEASLKKPVATNDEKAVAFLQSARDEDQVVLTLARVELAEAKARWPEARRYLAELEKSRIPDWLKKDLALARARSLRVEKRLGDALVQYLASDEQAELLSLWTELGGSEQSLATLKGVPSAKDEQQLWTPLNKAVAPFSMKDTSGKTWTQKELLGKRVLINLWASWCGPCKWELPHVAELMKLAKGKDLVVFALSVDDDAAAAAAYLAQHPLDVPVILNGRDLASTLTNVNAIPRSLLIDKKGTLTHELVGFKDAENWAAQMLKQIEALAP